MKIAQAGFHKWDRVYGLSVVLSISRNSMSSVTKCGWMCCRASPFFMAASGNQKPPCQWVNERWLFFSTLTYSTVSSEGWQLSSIWTVLKYCYMKLIMCTKFGFQCCSDRLVLNIWHRKHSRHFHQLCYDLVWRFISSPTTYKSKHRFTSHQRLFVILPWNV